MVDHKKQDKYLSDISCFRCGTGAIVGYWENILLMVGPQKDWIK